MIALRAARIATPGENVQERWVVVRDGLIATVGEEPPPGAHRIDLGKVDLIPGIVDLHSDCLDDRIQLRPTNRQPIEAALLALDAEAATHAITTQFVCASFEDDPVGHRSTESAAEIVRAVVDWREHLRVDTRVHLRYELTSERLELVRELAALDTVGLISYMDHSPGQGQFTSERAWRAWYARRFEGDEAALDDLIARRRARQGGVEARRAELAELALGSAATLASHDDDTVADVERSAELGSSIAEFPVSALAAAAASAAGLGVVMGAPNAQRGRSHMDGLSARRALSAGHLDALASDYHPGSLIAAAYQLAAEDVCEWADAVALVSCGPARIAGLSDRGRIAPGQRADLAAVEVVRGRPIVRQLWVGGRSVLGRDGALTPAEPRPSAPAASAAAQATPDSRSRQPQGGDTCIRPARWADRRTITELIEEMEGHADAAHRDGTHTAIAASLELPTARLLVAEDDRGVVVGYVELQSRPGTLHGSREAWIAGLSVLPRARGAGVGGRLLEAARREATMLGCDELVLESSVGRWEAHRFYRERGFRDASPAARLRAPVTAPAGAALQERFLLAAAQAATAVAAVLPSRAERMPAAGGFDTEDKFVDLRAEQIALACFEPLDVPIISEESGVIGARPLRGETWISLDPLDGTRNCMHGLAPFALSAGLVCDEQPVAGFVCDLSSGRRWWAGPDGARVDGRQLRPRSGGMLTLPSSPPNDLPALRSCGGFERVRLLGSTAIDLCHVADGTCGAFCDLTRAVARVHDLAGAMAVLRAAGATVLTEDGQMPLLVADPDVRFHVVAAATEHEARALLENAAAPTEAARMS